MEANIQLAVLAHEFHRIQKEKPNEGNSMINQTTLLVSHGRPGGYQWAPPPFGLVVVFTPTCFYELQCYKEYQAERKVIEWQIRIDE